jgi:hypothetical protein
MVRIYPFSRARVILLKGLIERKAITPNAVYFIVKNERGEEYNVSYQYFAREGKNSLPKWNCDCPFMGVQGIKNNCYCSHIIACIGWLIGIRKKQE